MGGLAQEGAKWRGWTGMALCRPCQRLLTCQRWSRIGFLNAHWSLLEKVQGALLITAQASKWRSAPGDGNTRN